MNEKLRTYTMSSHARKRWWLLTIPLAVFGFFAFRNMGLPGLYMDSVNPDCQAIWILRGNLHIPAWIFPDNYFAGPYKFPLLNSMYGGNITAYLGLLFFQLTGFGLENVRVYHALLGLFVLSSLFWCLSKWKISPIASAIALSLLALDPTFLFAWRTEYYLQLVPVIFVALGLGLLGIHWGRRHLPSTTKANRNLLFCAGFLFGFAAYSYFIFAFYAFVIAMAYVGTMRVHSSIRQVAIPLIGGTAFGWLPFLYAHVSIILNTNFQTYLEMLKGLQTTYGVVDQAQGGIVGRLYFVWERFSYMIAGHSIQMKMFGNWVGSPLVKVLHFTILTIGPVICLVFLFRHKMRSGAKVIHNDESPKILFMKLTGAILIIHLFVGIIIGRPLNLQHYVMLLPVLYAMGAIAADYVIQASVAIGRLKSIARPGLSVLVVGLLATNFSLSSDFEGRLKQTGGQELYSDVINVAASHIKRLHADTVLLFPQWGYWMGMITIIGPEFSAYEAPTLNDMRIRLRDEPELRNQQLFALVVGPDVLNAGLEPARQRIGEFASESELEIQQIVYLEGRNGVDQLWLVKMMRSNVRMEH